MTLIKIVFLACVLVVTAKPFTEEERHAMYKDIATKCKAEEGASDADLAEIAANKPASTRTAQCLNACIMENIGFIQNGKLSIEGSVKLAQMTGDPARVKNVELVSKECSTVVGADRCDTALQIMLCVGKTAVAHGLDPAKDLM